MNEQVGEGKLYLVGTPIGNLEDMTYRAVRILGEVGLIAAEDTRRTKKLLDHFDIKTRMISYHSHNEHKKTEGLIEQVLNGESIALVSDAGMPCIADPGFLIAREAVKHGIEPIVIPGVSSLTFAAAACAIPVETFTFYGFLPVKSGRRKAVLDRIVEEGRTAFVFESPYRIEKLLKAVDQHHPELTVILVREATKIYEEVVRGTASEILKAKGEAKWKGEFVVVLSPR